MSEHESAVSPPAARQGGAALASALLLFAVILAATLWRYAPPAARATSADAAVFSAGRALEILAKIVGDGAPRTPGSAAHARARGVIVAELERLGLHPEVQSAVSCRWSRCATVDNVVARLDGTDAAGGAVALVAHYDSVGAGSGAADDGSGVAVVLEVARALAAGPAPRNAVIWLVDDGEEPGLLGARAFADRHPWAAEVRAVINLEARGSSGPSLMFETGRDDAALLPHFARSVARPVASSLFASIYDILPNDTDFSVFKQAGTRGFNFAFIAEPENYHRSSDRIERLDPGSVQHQGDNVLALTRSLAAADLGAAEGRGKAVFFDLLAFAVLWWPASWTLPLAVAVLLVLAAVVAVLLRRGEVAVWPLIWGEIAWWGMLIAGALAAFVLKEILGAVGALPPPGSYGWIARPAPALLAFAAAGFAVTAAVARALAGKTGFWGSWAGLWCWWGLGATALAVIQPGMSYLLLVPAAAAALLGAAALAARSELVRRAAAVGPAAVAAVLWCAILALFLYPGLGVVALPVVGALTALVATSLAPLIADYAGRLRRAWPLAAALVGAAAAITAVAMPRYTAQTARPFDLVLFQDADSGQSRWLVSRTWRPVPERLRRVAELSARPEPAFPWTRRPYFAAAASVDPLAPPELTVVADEVARGVRTLRARLRSPRGAPIGRLLLSPEAPIGRVTLAGEELPLGEGSGWKSFTYLTLPEQGVELELRLTGAVPIEVYLTDQSPGLPPAGDELVAALPPTVSPMQDGHVTVVSRRLRLELPEPGASPAAETLAVSGSAD